MLVRGYVANRRELAGLLGAPGGRDAPDAELLALAYRRFGDRMAARVHGEYAAAVLDERTGDALLAHDGLGLVPLFYARRGTGLAFSTHLTELVRALGPGELDEEYIADYLVLGQFATRSTPYGDVARLMPGEVLRWERGRASVRRVWDLAEVEPLRLAGDSAYEQRLRELLEEAVTAAGSGGRAWGQLSGGLDSSTVVSVAASAGLPVEAISTLYPSMRHVDEEPWMRDVVEMHGLPWHRLDAEEALPFSALPGGFDAEPTVGVIDRAYQLREDGYMRERGVDIVMTGDGGDDVLCSAGGPPRHLADSLYRLRPLRTLRDVERWRRASRRRRSTLYWLARHGLEPALDHLRGRGVRDLPDYGLPPWIDESYARSRRLSDRTHVRRATRARTPGLQAMWNGIWIMSTCAGVSGQRPAPYAIRRPLLHRPLVEFMFAIPWEQKLRADCDRYLQRRALRGILPESVRRRAGKYGYSQPLYEGLRQSPEWVDLLTDRPRLAERGIVRLEAWREAVSQARFGRTHTDRHFMAAVSLEAWLQQLETARLGPAT